MKDLLNTEFGGKKYSRYTIKKTLEKHGYKPKAGQIQDLRVKASNAQVPDDLKKRRVKWAKERVHWTVEQWLQVIWSHESGRLVGPSPSHLYYWARPEEREEVEARVIAEIAEKFTGTEYQDNYVSYWAAIDRDGVGPISIVPHKHRMNKDIYIETLKNCLEPRLAELKAKYPNSNFIFQQDCAPPHAAAQTKKYLENVVEVMPWVPNSLDLNPMQQVWHMLNRRIDQRSTEIHNYKDMERIVQEEWKKIPPSAILDEIKTMPEKCRQVIKNKGGRIKAC